MEKLSMQEVQKISTDILIYIDKICRENKLNYSIFYGSLIGVERHQGFIPWDDDIDIVMPRKDYNKLLTLLAKDQRYLLLSNKTRDHYRYPFAKLVDPSTTVKTKQYFGYEDKDLGVFVDIFPIDMIPSKKDERDKFQLETETYRKNMMDTLKFAYARSFSLTKSLAKLILRFPHHKKLKSIGNDEYWREKYEKNATRFQNENTGYCGYLEFINIHWGVFPSFWFENYEDVLFEGHKIRAIKNRKEFLTLRYDDYMQLPPENERKTHHPYDFYKK